MANEKRMIDVEQAKRATYEDVFWTESEQAVVRNFLARLPKVYAVEVVHGRWIKDQQSKFEHRYNCSACNYRLIDEPCNYCANCGARMDGGN